MTFAQRFTLQGRVAVIEWHCPRDGAIVIDSVEGIDASLLQEPVRSEAYFAVQGRMAEHGPHRDEPEAI